MAQKVAVVRGNLPTTNGGTVDLTLSGFGTASAAIIIACNANNTNNPQNDAALSIGFWDGTNDQAMSFLCVDNGASSTTSSSSTTSFGVFIGAGGENYSVSAITDGIRLTAGGNYSRSRFVTVLLINGISAKVGQITLNSSVDGTTTSASLGFQPKVVFLTCIRDDNANVTDNAHASLSFGVATNAPSQHSIGWFSQNGQADETAWIGFSDAYSVSIGTDTADFPRGEVTAFNSDDFTLTTRLFSPGSNGVCLFLALGGADLEFDAGTLSTLTGGGDSVVGTDISPAALLVFSSLARSTTVATDGDANGLCIGLADFSNEYSHNALIEDGAATMNCESRATANRVIAVDDSTGGSSTVQIVSSVVFNSSDFTLTYSSAISPARKGWWMVFGGEAADQTVTPNFISAGTTVPNPTLDLSLLVTPNFVSAGTTLFNPTLDIPITVTPNLLASTVVVYQPSIQIAGDFLAGYALRKQITFDRTNLDATVANPVLRVVFTDDPEIGAIAHATGQNIRFTTEDGNTICAYDRRSFAINGSDEASGAFFVRYDGNVTVGGSECFYIYYDNPSASDGNDPDGTWADYEGVWHCDEDPSGSAPQIIDSTGNGHDGTSAGSMTSGNLVSAFFEDGLTTDGTDDNIACGAITGLNSIATASLQAIVFKADNTQAIAGGANPGTTLSGVRFAFIWYQDSTLYVSVCGAFGAAIIGTGGTKHIAALYDGNGSTDADRLVVTVNGAPVTLTFTGTIPATLAATTGNGFYIGRDGSDRHVTGLHDEYRVALTRLSNARLKFEYFNSTEADNELTFGAEEEDDGNISVVPNFISAGTTLFNPTLNIPITLTPNFIAAGTTLFNPSLDIPITVTPNFLASTVVVQEPTITFGGITVTPDFIAAGTTVQEPTVTIGGVTVTPDFIAAGTTVQQPTITFGGITVTPDFIAAGTVVQQPTIALGTLTVTPDFIASATVFQPTITLGELTVSPGFIAAGTTVPQPSVILPSDRSPDFIPSGTVVSQPTIGLGEATVSPAFVSAATVVQQPTVTTTLTVTPAFVASTTTVQQPTIVFGDATISPAAIPGGSVVFQPTIVMSSAPTAAGARRQIVVDQEPGGENYPFIYPSDDLGLLIADFYLNYRDDACAAAHPLRISWLWNFGTGPGTGVGGYTHEFDLLISDDDDNVIFDSREADNFQTVPWGNDKVIIEWVNTETFEVCRVVLFTAWAPDQTPITWSRFIEPEDGRLDPRTYERSPRGVTSLSVDLNDNTSVDIPAGSQVVFQSGYNYDLVLGASEDVDGSVLRNTIDMSAIPGAGLGRFPGCEDEETSALRINGVQADEAGNVAIDATGCYRLELVPTEINGDVVTVSPSGWQLANNCGPCYTCDDFVLVYNAIRRLYLQYKALGIRAEAVRDQLQENIERWEENRECRRAFVLRTNMMSLGQCRAGIAVAVCNNSDGPLQNVTLGVTITTTADGLCLVCNSVFRKGNIDPTNGVAPGQMTPYALGGTFPASIIAEFDCVNPGTLGYVVFQVEALNATDSDTITVEVEALDGILATPRQQTIGVRCSSNLNPLCCENTTTSSTLSGSMLNLGVPKAEGGPIAKLLSAAGEKTELLLPYGNYEHALQAGDEVDIRDTTPPRYIGRHKVLGVMSKRIVRLDVPFAGEAVGGHWFKV